MAMRRPVKMTLVASALVRSRLRSEQGAHSSKPLSSPKRRGRSVLGSADRIHLCVHSPRAFEQPDAARNQGIEAALVHYSVAGVVEEFVHAISFSSTMSPIAIVAFERPNEQTL